MMVFFFQVMKLYQLALDNKLPRKLLKKQLLAKQEVLILSNTHLQWGDLWLLLWIHETIISLYVKTLPLELKI